MKRIAVIDDLCGYGKCSLGISIPILSAAKLDVCNIPTSLFSHHTALPNFSILDTGDIFDDYITKLRELNVKFDAIYTANFIDKKQIYSSMQFIADNEDAKIFVDPVLGDFGRLYNGKNESIIPHLKKL